MESRVVRVEAPAKVNLFLGVGGLRDDGYHHVTTVLHALELCDVIEIRPAPALALTCRPDVCVPAERNLAWRAAAQLAAGLGHSPDVSIDVHKRIPHGAGLGGGSADAAAVIAGLADLWGVDRRDPVCLQVAASLGADVPFFLGGSGCALMSGRGDVLECELPALGGLTVVLVKPPQPVPTAAAYTRFDADPREPGDAEAVVAALESRDERALVAALCNNMQDAAFSLVPEVRAVVDMVSRTAGVLGAIVAGSGSAVAGICEDDEVAATVARLATSQGWWAAVTKLRGSGVTVERR